MGKTRISRRKVLGIAATVGISSRKLSANPPRRRTQKVPTGQVRIAVVGGGFGADFHWHEHPNSKVTAVSDLRPERRDRLMRRYACGDSYNSLEYMLEEAKNIDAVAIFTEAPNHERHVKMCMDRGLHVISAVPACLTLEEASRLKETQRRTGCRYMMAETSYFRHYCIAARELFQKGSFGEIFYSEVEYYHSGIGHASSPLSHHQGNRTWRYGYPPMLYPTHSTGLLIGVTGEHFTEVSCLGWSNSGSTALKDNIYGNSFSSASALFKTNLDHMCRCNVFWDGTAEGERAQWFGTELSFFMPSGSGQSFSLKGPRSPGWVELPNYWPRLPDTLEHNLAHGGSHPFLTHEFVSALLEDRDPAVNLRDALAMTVPGIVAHTSAKRGGEQLKVPGFDQL